MQFVGGLRKVAEFVRHNDGSEFKTNDTEPAIYAAGAASAPTGTAFYQPASSTKSKEKAAKKEELLNILMGKMSSADIASTGVTQLKWETSHDDIPENFGASKANQYSPAFKSKGKRRVS